MLWKLLFVVSLLRINGGICWWFPPPTTTTFRYRLECNSPEYQHEECVTTLINRVNEIEEHTNLSPWALITLNCLEDYCCFEKQSINEDLNNNGHNLTQLLVDYQDNECGEFRGAAYSFFG